MIALLTELFSMLGYRFYNDTAPGGAQNAQVRHLEACGKEEGMGKAN
jgi:hypothetical protein